MTPSLMSCISSDRPCQTVERKLPIRLLAGSEADIPRAVERTGMATATRGGPAGVVREHPLWVTVVLSVVGYALVGGAFAGVLPIFPPLSDATVLLFSDAIAVVNSLALASLLVGWYFIRNGEVRKHRAAMITAFCLISLFLVLYLWKVGGGFEKSFVVPSGTFLAGHAGLIEPLYLAMLAIHVFLSVVSVPVVLFAVVLGLTHTPAELRNTRHAQVGRVAVVAWSVSLFLGIVTYVMLNHVYGWVPRGEGAALPLLFLAVPRPVVGSLRSRLSGGD
jgi:putative membrane protein